MVCAIHSCRPVCATFIQVSWCLLRSLAALLTECERGKAFRLTLARNIIGHLRFPVARKATSAIPLELLVLLGSRLELVMSVAALRNVDNAVLGAPRLNLVVADRSRERPLRWEVLRGLMDPLSLVSNFDPLNILVMTLSGPELRVCANRESVFTRLWNVCSEAVAWAGILTLLKRTSVQKKSALRLCVQVSSMFLVWLLSLCPGMPRTWCRPILLLGPMSVRKQVSVLPTL